MVIVCFEYDKYWKNYVFNVVLNGCFLFKVNMEEYILNIFYEEIEKVIYLVYIMWKFMLFQKVWKGVDMILVVDNLFNYVFFCYYNNLFVIKGIIFLVGLLLDIE